MRQRGIRQWKKDDAQAQDVRAVGKRRKALDQADESDQTDQTDREVYFHWLDDKDPAVVANAIICLIHQANYLLDLQIAALERQFVKGGGYSEKLAAERIEKRKRDLSDPSETTDRTDKTKNAAPTCPLCKGLMVLRTSKKGGNAGSQFWGCAGYPKCKGTLRLDGSGRAAEKKGGV